MHSRQTTPTRHVTAQPSLLAFAACATVLALGLSATPAAATPSPRGALSFPQTRAATYDEIRAHQAVGRAIVSRDGTFFIYEWLRPYNWAPDVQWLHPRAAKRMQGWLYKVDVTPWEDATSRYLFHPDPGSSYYLGSLSPDGNKVSVYEVDHDQHAARAGVWDMALTQITWFDIAPDTSRLEEGPIWATPDEIAYPTPSGWARGRVPTRKRALEPILDPEDMDDIEKAVACTDCVGLKDMGLPAGRYSGAAEPPASAGPGAQVLAQSQEGELSVFLRDSPDALTLMYQKGTRAIVTVFDNDRKPQNVLADD